MIIIISYHTLGEASPEISHLSHILKRSQTFTNMFSSKLNWSSQTPLT